MFGKYAPAASFGVNRPSLRKVRVRLAACSVDVQSVGPCR
jgi:hypothetical protein